MLWFDFICKASGRRVHLHTNINALNDLRESSITAVWRLTHRETKLKYTVEVGQCLRAYQQGSKRSTQLMRVLRFTSLHIWKRSLSHTPALVAAAPSGSWETLEWGMRQWLGRNRVIKLHAYFWVCDSDKHSHPLFFTLVYHLPLSSPLSILPTVLRWRGRGKRVLI